MSDAHADVSKHVKSYIAVFVTLAVLTVVTVLAAQVDISRWGLPAWGNIALALAIASVKASLVAYIFMHLKWEKASWVWFTILLCAFFFIVLMALPTLTVSDHPPGVKIGTWG